MNDYFKALGIDKLSLAERLALLEEIWDSITDDSSHLEVPKSHKEEMDRRLSAHNLNPKAGSTWEVVKARLQTRSDS